MLKLLEVNGQRFEWAESVKVEEYLLAPRPADKLLLDCRHIGFEELSGLIDKVQTRFIVYAYADILQKRLLDEMGHFDLTEFWELPDFQQVLQQIFEMGGQVQGFSLAPDEAACIPDDFGGGVERRGRYEMLITGDFPEPVLALDFKRLVANWMKPIYVVPLRRFYNGSGKYLLTFDWETTGNLRVTYVLTTLDKAGNLLKQVSISEKEAIFVAPEAAEYRCQVYLEGTGAAKLGKVWTYKYKYGLGYFQAGDRRTQATSGEWVHSLSLPGRNKKRLIVGFSGNLSELPQYERQSMAKYGHPVLLFCDLRARGGAFQLGRFLNEAYEAEIMRLIDEKLGELQLTRQDVIFTGWSMGTFPAMYYGMKMQAGHVIAAKPLLHLGRVTSNLKTIYRTEPSMISAREYLMGRNIREDEDRLNRLIGDTLADSDINQTHFYSFHMSNDELDRCEDFFEYDVAPKAKAWESERTQGFHADQIPRMGRWINDILDRICGGVSC